MERVAYQKVGNELPTSIWLKKFFFFFLFWGQLRRGNLLRIKTLPRGYQSVGYKPNAVCRGPPLLISQVATVRIVRSVRILHISAEKRKEHGPRASLSGHAVGRVSETQILMSNEEKKSGLTLPGIEPELLELPCL